MTNIDDTPGKRQTAAARLGHRKAAARRHAAEYIAKLELIGYTVIPPAPTDECDQRDR